MKITVYVEETEDGEEIKFISEPVDISDNNITVMNIFEKMQSQRSRMLKDRLLAHMELLLK